MNKRTLFFTCFLGLLIFVLVSFSGQESKYPQGAPAGYTGSPADTKNCTQCHGGTPATVSGWITSDVPIAGYTPGDIYTITVTVTGSGRKGFEVSPQSISGALLGTLTAGSGNQVVGTKYVTHSAAISGSSATWTFNWTAPAAGTGAVTFYGAFAISQSSTKLSTLVVAEKNTTLIYPLSNEMKCQFFPNPVRDEMSIFFSLQNSERISILIYDISGKEIKTLLDEVVPSGLVKRSFKLRDLLPSGIYFVTLSNGSTIVFSKKIILSF
jgi:hypothetical protein